MVRKSCGCVLGIAALFVLGSCDDSPGVGEGGSFTDLGITADDVSIFNILEDAGPNSWDDPSNEAPCEEGGSVRWRSSGQEPDVTVTFTYEACVVSFQIPDTCHEVEVSPGIFQITCDTAREELSGTRTWHIYDSGSDHIWEDSSRLSGSGDLGFLMECDLAATTNGTGTTYSGECVFSDSSGAEIVIPVSALEP